MTSSISSVLTRVLDAGGQRRLIDAWADPEVNCTTIKTRFKLQQTDIELLKLELGPKVKPTPLSPFWRKERDLKRFRRGWA